MEAMHWSYQDYRTTPVTILRDVVEVLNARGKARKHLGEVRP